jgi:hypothetical protein
VTSWVVAHWKGQWEIAVFEQNGVLCFTKIDLWITNTAESFQFCLILFSLECRYGNGGDKFDK